MKFSCEQCGTRYSIADQKVEGKRLRIRCKVCNFIMDVRGTPKHLIRAAVSRSETAVQAAPDLATATDWYVAKDGEPAGPITFTALAAEIKARRIPRDVLVWNENFSDWKSAADVPELARLLPPPVPMPETAMDTVDAAEVGSSIAEVSTQPAKYEDFDAPSEGYISPDDGESFTQSDEGGAELDAQSAAASGPETDEDVSLSGIEFIPDEPSASDTPPTSDLSESKSDAALVGEKEAIDLDSSAQAESANFQRDHTEMVSLDEIEGLDRSDEDADFSSKGKEDDSTAELSSESHAPVESDDGIDLGIESSAPLEGGEAQNTPLESEDDFDQASSSGHGSESDDAVKDAPVWLGTDDSLPEFEPLTESAQVEDGAAEAPESLASAVPDAENEGLVFPDAASINQPEVQALSEPTAEASTDVETGDAAAVNDAMRRDSEPAAPILEARQTFTLPDAPVKEKREGSSKTMPAVLIAVVGIVLVSFVVLKDNEQAVPPSVSPTVSAASQQSVQSPEDTSRVAPTVAPTEAPRPKATSKVAATGAPAKTAKPTSDEPAVAAEPPAPQGTKQATAPLKSEKSRKRTGGLLEQEVTKKPIATPKPASPKKKSKRQRKTKGLLATSVGSKPDEEKQNVGGGLLAALSADDDEEVDVTKLGSLQGARSTKGKSRGKGRSDRLMKSGNRLETFESTKMAKTDSTSASLRTNRERLLDLPSEEEDVDSGGDFPAEEVSKIFNRERKGINVCYSRHLKKGGRRFKRQLKLVFTVRPTGAASNVSIGPKYQRTVMRSCLSKFLARIKFPPFDGTAQQVEFNLKLSNIY